MIRKLIIILAISISVVNSSSAQCNGGTNAGNITLTNSWQFINYVNGGTYYSFTANANTIYNFSFCVADGGFSLYDNEITILNPVGNPVDGGFSQDACLFNASVSWLCNVSATYRVLVTKKSCSIQSNLGKLAYRSTSIATCPSGLGAGVTKVGSLPYSSGAGSTAGAVNNLTSANIDVCGNNSYLSGEDRVWIFTPITSGTVTITLTTPSNRGGLYLYKGCPLSYNNSVCVGNALGVSNPKLTSCVEANVTYYLIVDSKFNTSNFTYTNLSITAPTALNSCSIGKINSVPSLPYSSSGRTTCGKGNDLSSSNTRICGNNAYLSGEDEVFSFTPTISGNILVAINSSNSYSGLFLFDGCPLTSYCNGKAVNCINNETSPAGSKSLCGYVVAGKTYYIVVDRWANCLPYSISISAPTSSLVGATCANPVTISSLPYLAMKENTACMGDDYNNFKAGTCGSLYESGEDKVYKYTASSAECIAITLSGASDNSIGYTVFNGVPGNPSVTCIGNAGGANSGVLNGSVTLPAAGDYYIMVDTWADPRNVQYNIGVTTYGTAIPNDTYCTAQEIPLGVSISGDNSCSTGAGEPQTTACWTTPNTLNTVWYSFIAPASGKAIIRTAPGTLTNTQIAVYSGSCGGGITYLACNDNAAACGITNTFISQVTINSLVPNVNYFVAVDGVSSLIGTFGITVIDGNTSLPSIYGQECSMPLPVCDTTVTVGNPGFQLFGNNCDFTGTGANCLDGGERGSAWYEIQIKNSGFLDFTIIPNDWGGAPSLEGTDYDFAIWKTAGAGATTCSLISSGATPIRCNYSYLSVTGLYSSTDYTENPNYPGFGFAFMSQIPVEAREKYLLVISNYSNSISGFSLNFGANSPIDYEPSGTNIVWTGASDNDWFKRSNWGGCPVPNCGKNAIIVPAPVNQPIINTAGANVQSLNITTGATLTINNSYGINVCGDFINSGWLNARSGSSINFNGTGTQTISGNLDGASAFADLTTTKTSGSVVLSNKIEVNGNFTISNPTSSFNGNGKAIYLRGNFNNINGTFDAGTGGLLSFIGNANQTYFNSGILNSVSMNKTGNSVTLNTDMKIGTSGVLTLNNGIIKTGASREVNVLNDATNAISTGTNTSYVEGFLRRSVPLSKSARSFDFPVGHTTAGYQRINLAMFNGVDPSIASLRMNFETYPTSAPGPMGLDPSCGVSYTDVSLNNGYWNLIPQGSGEAQMHVTLFNKNYTNATSAFSVMLKDNKNGWQVPTVNSGGCLAAPVTAVLRNGLQLNFTSGLPYSFGTAQGNSTLPVSMLSFIAKPATSTIINEWITATETNNRGFDIQKSTNGKEFTTIGWVDGNGTTDNSSDYSFEDKDVRANVVYYYRLKQIDNDGKESLSKVVASVIKDISVVVYDVFPNPYKDMTQLRYIITRPANVTIEISDILGRMVKKYQQGLQDEGTYSIPFSAKQNGYPAGIYNLTLWCDDQHYTVKLNEN